MKNIIVTTLLLSSSFAYSKEALLRKVDNLESRMQALEVRVRALETQKNVTKSGGLKVKDMNNEIKGTQFNRGVAAESELVLEQRKQIMKDMQNIKEQRAKSKQLLDEIMNEDN
jgi:tetrahydromethanopterin S-methyltransferase subunit B